MIARSNSSFTVTVSSTGWPDVQHRGGERGFVQIVDAQTLRIPDFERNKQMITIGNLVTNDRVSLIFVDYQQKLRLMVWGNATVEHRRFDGDYAASKVPRWLRILIVALIFNCPAYIPTP
jgi:uncharacterized protein